MVFESWVTLEKKRIGYKERCEQKRQTYLQELAALKASGKVELMFLPPYSPDYNPIEHDFANIKRKREYQPEKSIEDIIEMYK